MNRVIKFRGKCVNTGKWVYGDLIKTYGIGCFIRQIEPPSFDYYDPIPPDIVDYKVDPATVGQFTGLTDRGGVWIYEGDLVKYNGTERDRDYEGRESKVENKGGCLSPFFEEVGNSSGFMYETRIDFDSIEVVGSIYEDLKA